MSISISFKMNVILTVLLHNICDVTLIVQKMFKLTTQRMFKQETPVFSSSLAQPASTTLFSGPAWEGSIVL